MFLRSGIVISAILCSVSIDARSQLAKFKPGCDLPFKDIQTKGLDIDTRCSIDGGSTETGKRLESDAKNNFCATDDVGEITYSTFKRLQTASDRKDNLKDALNSSRSELKNLIKLPDGPTIGEGSVVQFVAFIFDAHNSNVSKGELVNCKRGGKESNDIHIELMPSADEDDECKSVTAEMSPHFRPETWSALPDMQIKRPVRIKGQLFFDGSHTPCKGRSRPNPKRISVWEIHPVYAIDVCTQKTLAACEAGDDALWIPLDQWHSHADEEADQ